MCGIDKRVLFNLRFENFYDKVSEKETRGPRGPWNAHLRQKIFKSSLFIIALCTTGDTWEVLI